MITQNNLFLYKCGLGVIGYVKSQKLIKLRSPAKKNAFLAHTNIFNYRKILGDNKYKASSITSSFTKDFFQILEII